MKDFDLYPSLTLKNYDESLADHLKNVVIHPRVSALRLEFSDSPSEKFIKFLTSLLRPHDVALILAPLDHSTCDSLPLKESDGLHFQDLPSLKKGLPLIKSLSLQTGCSCLTLDEAMYAGETGADYISFPAESLDIIEKWSAIAELPCVAEAPSSPVSALEAVQKGAEFVSFPLKGDDGDFEWTRALTNS